MRTEETNIKNKDIGKIIDGLDCRLAVSRGRDEGNSPKIRENRKTCNKEETEEERKEESEKEREREEARSKGRFQNVEEGSTTYYLVA